MEQWLHSVYSDSTKHYVSNPSPRKGEEVEIRLRMCRNSYVKKVLLRTREFGIERLHEMHLERIKNELVY